MMVCYTAQLQKKKKKVGIFEHSVLVTQLVEQLRAPLVAMPYRHT